MTWAQFKDLLPAITFALGIGGALAIEWARTRWTETARVRAARDDFRRSTIVQLQTALEHLVEAAQDVAIARRDAPNVDLELQSLRYRLDLECDGLCARLSSADLRSDGDRAVQLLRELALDEPAGGTPGSPDRPWLSTTPDGIERAAEVLVAVNDLVDRLAAELRSLHGL